MSPDLSDDSISILSIVMCHPLTMREYRDKVKANPSSNNPSFIKSVNELLCKDSQ